MTEHIPVQAARIPDRDRLLEELREAGLDAKPVGEIEIEVSTDDLEADEPRGLRARRADDHVDRRALRADQARGRDLHPPASFIAERVNREQELKALLPRSRVCVQRGQAALPATPLALEQRRLALADADAQRGEAVAAAAAAQLVQQRHDEAGAATCRADGRARSRRRSRSPSPRSRPSSRTTASDCDANASFSSTRSSCVDFDARTRRAACGRPARARCPSRAGRPPRPRCRRTSPAARRRARAPSPPTRSRARRRRR